MIILTLQTDDQDRIVPSVEGKPLAEPTPLSSLPSLKVLQAAPFTQGLALTEALGGQALFDKLDADADRLLLLDADEPAQAIPWEYAALSGRRLLVCSYGILRLADGRPLPPEAGTGGKQALHFVALAADPLVDDQGQPREGYRLNLEHELRAIRRTLEEGGKELQGQRIPPTRQALRRALRQGPALLHLACHGDVVDSGEAGPMAVLFLEDEDGGQDRLLGRDLMEMPPAGVLRLVLLSACHTAKGQANLARALVLNGVPAAIGMQGLFPDPLSDELAVALYEFLLAGYPLGESLRQARQALMETDYRSAGLPVCYVSAEGWEALPVLDGIPAVSGLGLPGLCRLPQEVQPPRPLLGRNGELHALALLYSQGKKVVTVVGTGGVGKTALAAAFAERFAWRWPRGVLSVSFAAGEVVDAARWRAELLLGLAGEQMAVELASAPAAEQAREVLAIVRDWDGLLLLDNYESVLQGLQEGEAGALEVHRLVYQLAEGGASLLLTSRQHPARVPNEVVFPDQATPLPGLRLDPAAELFLQHSTKARTQGQTGKRLAADIARATEGHPLAIALLAGEYDESEVPPGEFLAGWGDELAAAQGYGLAEHHRTFVAAFRRSYDRFLPRLQARLRALSVFAFPFLVEGAALVWGLGTEDEDFALARQDLGRLARASLLEVEGRYEDGTPAAYRFQPALHQAAAWMAAEHPTEHEAQAAGYAAYGAWLARRGYGNIHRDLRLARLVRLSLEALDAATCSLSGTEQLWHINRLAWLKNAYGETGAAYDLLESAVVPSPDPEEDAEGAKTQSALRFELAKLCVTRGDLDRALALYQESLQLYEQLGDEQNKAALLAQIAQVFRTRGDLDRAVALYQESLQLKEQLGDKLGKSSAMRWLAVIAAQRGDLDGALRLYQQTLAMADELGDMDGKASSLHEMAAVYHSRGDLDRALDLYQQSLQLVEGLGAKGSKASVLHNMAQVYVSRGDLDRALDLYRRSLQLKEQLGNKQGKAATLSEMAGLYMLRAAWDEAQRLLVQALSIFQEIGAPAGVAFSMVKLGQVSQARGDRADALTSYREGLDIFERLSMPEAEQVRAMIASVEGGAVPASDLLRQAIAQARAAAARSDLQGAIAAQEEAVGLARQAGEERDALVRLSVSLYNLAGYYAQSGRHDDAVRALEEVVALDERTAHPDLESDQQALEQARRLASLPPEERERLQDQAQTGPLPIPAAGLPSELVQRLEAVGGDLELLTAEERAQLEAAAQAFARQLEAMSPEERAEFEAAARAAAMQGQIQSLADQARDGAIAAMRGDTEREPLAARIAGVAAQIVENEAPGSPWEELARYLRAVVALLREEPLPPAPEAHAAHLAAILAERR